MEIRGVVRSGRFAAVRSRIFPLCFAAIALLPFCPALVAQNATQSENAKPGSADWQLTNPATNHEIEGYASLTSVNRGGQISFYVNTADPTYTVEVFRMGWYSGAGARRVLGPVTANGTQQTIPTPDPTTGIVECQWTNPFTFSVPGDGDHTNWASGVYLARLTGNTSGKQSFIIFTVRDDSRSATYVFQLSINTFEAYNNWGGKSLYTWNSTSGIAAVNVSYNRPFALGNQPASASGVGAGEFLTSVQPSSEGAPAGWAYNMVRFLEREGYDVTYLTDVDAHESASLLMQHRTVIVAGHSEYWSWEMRMNLQAARDAGVGIAVFSANTCYWQIRFTASAFTGAPDRTIIGYKSTADPDASNPTLAHLTTVQWRQAPVNLPEEALFGVMYNTDAVNSNLVVASASNSVFTFTGVQNGTILQGLWGYEIDSAHGSQPAGTVAVMHEITGGGIPGDSTVYTAGSGATVFDIGSFQWNWGLDDYNVPSVRASVINPVAQQVTRNVLARTAGQPLSPSLSIVPSPRMQSVNAITGGTAGYTISLTPFGYSPVVTLSASGLPANTSATFSPSTLTAPGTSTLTVTVGASAPAGTYLITISAQDGVQTRTEAVTLTLANLSAKSSWRLVFADSQETSCANGAATNAFDGNLVTIWHTQYCPSAAPLPHEIQIDLGASFPLNGFGYLPRQDGGVNGRIGQYEFYVTNNLSNWGSPVATGVFANDATEKIVSFPQTSSRYVRLRALTEANGGPWTSMAELDLFTAAGGGPPDFSIGVSPASQTVVVGGSTTYTATVGALSGFTGTVSLSATGLPAGATASFNPASVTGSGSSALTVTTTASTPAGSSTLTITGTSSSLVHSATATLIVGTGGTGSGAISIDFVGNGTAMASTESAGVAPKTHWNSAAGAKSASALSLVDENGAATSATVAWTSDNPWALPITDQPGNVRMMRGYLDNGSGNPSTVTVSGLKSGTYNIYVYTDGDNAGSSTTGSYQISGTGVTTTSISATDAPNTNFSGTFVQASNSSGNYVLFGNVTLSSGFTLTATPGATTAVPRATVNGIQIVPVSGGPPDFSIGVSPGSQTVTAGGSTTYTATVGALSGFTGTVSLSATGLPTGATASFSPASITGSGTSTLTVTTTGSTPAGSSTLTITGTSGSLTHSTTATLIVGTGGTGSGAISIDFVGNGTAIGSTESAGVAPKTHWNSAVGAKSASPLGLVDENGAATGATVAWTSDNTWVLPIADQPGNVRMMRGYLDNGSGNPSTVALSGLKSGAYNIYVYSDGDTNGTTGIFQISGAGIATASISATDNTDFSGTFTQANNSNGNYVLFSNIALSSGFTLTATPGATSSAPRAPLNGIQLVPVSGGSPDFSIAVSPGSQTVTAGSSTTYTTTIGALSGFTGTVSLSASGLPAGATASFNPASVTGSGSSTLTVTTTGSTPAGSSTLTITGTSGSLTHSTTATLIVGTGGTGSGAISIDFVGSGTAMASTESAGVAPRTHWNSAAGAKSGSPLGLVDENGAATSATVSWTSDNPWALPITDQPGNVRMMRGYLDNGSGNPSTVTLSGLKSGTYNIYVYTDGDNAGSSTTGSYQISGTGVTTTSISATDAPNTNFSGTFVQATNSSGNYVLFSSVALGSGFTLTATPGATTAVPRATVNGIQIVPVSGGSPDFSIGVSPGSQTVTAGGSTTYTATVGALSGFTGTVNLSAAGLPTGATASFNPASVTGSGTSTLTVTTTGSTPAGSSTLTVTGTSGSLVHSATAALIVGTGGTGSGAISIDFVGNGTAMASAESAGVAPKTHWNSAAGAKSASALSLVDENGAATSATVAWTSDNTWVLPITDQPGNVRMMRGYLDNGAGNPSTLTFSGLAAGTYHIYVYMDGDNAGFSHTGSYQISGTGITTTSISATDAPNANFSGTFTQASNSNGNYVLFSNVAISSGFTLTATPGATGNVPRAPVNGIQIVPGP